MNTSPLNSSTGDVVTPESFGDRMDDPSLELNMAQLELLHNFCTSTCYTMSRNPVIQTIWRVTAPKIGLGCPFAMRAMLAMSAFQLARSQPEQREFYIAQANYHHDIALRIVTSILPGITKETCSGLYIFAALTCLISCAKPRPAGDFLFVGDRGIAEWLQLFKGTRFIVSQFLDILLSGPLEPIITSGKRRHDMRFSATNINPPYLQELRRVMFANNPALPHAAIYNAAIDELGRTFACLEEVSEQPHESSDVFMWMIFVPDEYLTLLSERVPEALVIFAFYCVALKQLEWAWWMEGNSSQLIAGIYQLLGVEHRIWIQWPIEQLGFVAT
jgi:hypothetical protein